MVTIYTDGACQGNGKEKNSGGFGVVAINEKQEIVEQYSKLCSNTTNNREELKAILYALIKYGTLETAPWEAHKKTPPTVYSDSMYAVNTFTKWMFNWEQNNWLKADKKLPENLDLIQAYFDLYKQGYRIDLRYVKGHAKNKWNEMADGLATGKIK